MSKFKLLFYLFFLIPCLITQGQDSLQKFENRNIFPDHTKFQFAGNIGFFSVGFGYLSFNDYLNTELLYGQVPSFISGSKSIHKITLKNTVHLYKFTVKTLTLSPIAGVAGSMELGQNSYRILPKHYPSGYYGTNSLHATFFGGLNLHKKFDQSKNVKGMDFYGEIGAVDTILWYTVKSETLKLKNILGIAVGVNIYF